MVNQFMMIFPIDDKNGILINIKNIIYVKANVIMQDNRITVDMEHTRLVYQEGNEKVIFIVDSPIQIFLEKLAKLADIVW